MEAPTLETPRLLLRPLAPEDAPFILEQLNEPSFLEFIGDKGVRTLADARDYIRQGPMACYEEHGFGLLLVLDRDTQTPMGTCGVLRRDSLDHPDLGFAFRPQFWSRGFAFEAAQASLAHAQGSLGLSRILAITSVDNEPSKKLLRKLGFVSQGQKSLGAEGTVETFELLS